MSVKKDKLQEKLDGMNEHELRKYIQELTQTLDKSTFAFDKIPELTDEYQHLLNSGTIPVLEDMESLSYNQDDSEAPSITLVEGDNLPSLLALMPQYENKVDVIYLDPPYNTGNDFVYNDKRVSSTKNKKTKGSLFKHSAWLSFMERRLFLARKMLAESGILLVSIDDNEHAHLKLLLDEIFGESNYIGTITWQGSPSSLSKFTSGGADYILAYGKNIAQAEKWRSKKSNVDSMLSVVKKTMLKTNSHKEATAELKTFITKNKAKLGKGLTSYNKVDTSGRIYSNAMLTNSLPRPNLVFPIIDPATGKSYNPPANGWKLSREKMQELLDEDLVIFGGVYPRKKLLLEDYMYALPTQSFFAPRTQGTTLLNKIVGKGNFHFPKNMEVIKEWISSVNSNPNAIIMDFFAGSGTTGHAVAALNSEDGGNRECVLVTSNENNIAQDVTAKRLKRVLSGSNWADGKQHPVLAGKLLYRKLTWSHATSETYGVTIAELNSNNYLPEVE